MENLVIQLSRYILIIMFTIYTIFSFTVFQGKKEERKKRIYRVQRAIMFFMHFLGHALLYLNTKKLEYMVIYAAELGLFILILTIYRIVYKNLSDLILNHTLMLISISFTMLARLDLAFAKKQLIMVAVGFLVCLVVPVIIKKFRYLEYLGWVYAALGLLLLMLVFVPAIGMKKYGSLNWIQIFGVGLQPSEFVKIIFVFFLGGLLSKKTSFKDVVIISMAAAAYVLVLVAEKDLGGALIFFITYLSVLYVATCQPIYLISGLAAISAAAVIGYKLFQHVKVRVMAWQNPWKDITGGGYQIANSLFAIGTGGWFGLGLGKGLPTSIPVSESDFVFAAISEEYGGIFAVCIVLVYLSCFIMFVNISMKMKNQFYKLTAFGLSVQFIFQVFLNIGGVTKFIPSTGVTLPLISYGGSSILSVIIIFSIIQGMYAISQEGRQKKNEEAKL